MKVIVSETYRWLQGEPCTTSFEGSREAVGEKLTKTYPWLAMNGHPSVEAQVAYLDHSQAFSASIVEGDAPADEVFRLLKHPDPAERMMALKLEGSGFWHAMAALRDGDPEVRALAVRHPSVTAQALEDLFLSSGHGEEKLSALQSLSHLLAEKQLQIAAESLIRDPVPEAEEISRIIAKLSLPENIQPAGTPAPAASIFADDEEDPNSPEVDVAVTPAEAESEWSRR